MGHFGEKLIGAINWCFVILAAILTEDTRQVIMFFLGGFAALFTAAHKAQEMYFKSKDRKKQRENENKL